MPIVSFSPEGKDAAYGPAAENNTRNNSLTSLVPDARSCNRPTTG